MLQPDFQSEIEDDSKLGMTGIRGVAAPKFSDTAKPAASTRKAGAISMFDEAEIPQEPAEKKTKDPAGQAKPTGVPRPNAPGAPSADPSVPMTRVPRPLPPRPMPAGIPDGQPLPPETRPQKEVKDAAPVRPPPNRNRAPPIEDPNAPKPKIIVPDPNPPGTVPPFIRGLKPPPDEGPPVKRRDRELPEFESSSEDEEEVKAKTARKAKRVDPIAGVNVPLAVNDVKARALVDATSRGPAASAPTSLPAKPTAAAGEAEKASAQTPSATKKVVEMQLKPESISQPAPAASKAASALDDPTRAGGVPETPVVGTPAAAAVAQPVVAQLKPQQPAAALVVESQPVPSPAPPPPQSAPKPAPPQVIEPPPPMVEEAEVAVAPPSDVRMELTKNAFIAPPPIVDSSELNFNSPLLKYITSGRLSIRCIEGIEIQRKDDPNKVPRTDPFLKFKLGAAERHPWKSTAIKRKQTNFPKFDDEIVSFDVTDPVLFVFQEDVILIIEVWNKSPLQDECLGRVTMSVVRFITKPFLAFEERVPVYYPGATATNSKLRLEFIFEQARSGMFCITLYEARGLRNVDPLAHQDPYVSFSLGPTYTKRSKAIKDGGTTPYFSEESVLVFADGDNWVNDLSVNLFDQDLGPERPIGFTRICLLPYMNVRPEAAKEEAFDLFYSVLADPRDPNSAKEVACGELVMQLKFLPAGKLNILVDKAHKLSFPDTYTPPAGAGMSRMDPYVQFSLEGKAVSTIKRSPPDKDGGQDPVWQHEVKFDVVDQYMLDIQVFNQNLVGADVLLGYAQLSLLTVYRNGNSDIWVPLKQRKANGGLREIGDLRLVMKFEGPVGISYPQFRPDVDAFDDRMRKAPEKEKDVNDDEIKVKQPISTIPGPKVAAPAPPKGAPPPPQALVEAPLKPDAIPPEFTEEEIIAAFAFIDLDHNGFVGAKEIRHILVCMGEMVTDEEIDTMISLVDTDGDGQVSFGEFRTLVLHPDPGAVDLHKEVMQKKEDDVMKEKQAMAGRTSGLDLSTFQRQKEMSQREAKKKMLVAFVADNEVTFDFVKHSFQSFVELPPERRLRGKLKFVEFCKTLSVEPISEYNLLHGLFDAEELGEIDFREFLLSLMNFIDVDKEMRMRFSFTMFDERKSGFLTQKEIEEILRGNHMISLASVQRKAETVMRQAAQQTVGSITMNELVVISKKFPNIMLPTVGITK